MNARIILSTLSLVALLGSPAVAWADDATPTPTDAAPAAESPSTTPAPAVAPGTEWMKSFEVIGKLGKDGGLAIDEALTYDFGATDHHGIYRDLPTRYKDNNNVEYRPTLTIETATQDGQPTIVKQSHENGALRLQLGDANKVVTGVHVYRLHYRLAPAILQVAGKDTLIYNVTGNGWAVPIGSARFTLQDDATKRKSLDCYTGAAGQTVKGCEVGPSKSPGVVTTKFTLSPAEGLTVRAEYAAGSFTSYLKPDPTKRIQLGLVALGALGWLGGIAWLGWQRWQERRARRRQTIVAQYEAPDALTPAELGLLTDARGNMTEVTATLIDLAVRGHLKIHRTSAKTWWRRANYDFERLDHTADALKDYEQAFLDDLFDGKPSIKLTAVDRTKLAARISKLQNAIATGLKDRGYYYAKPASFARYAPILLLLAAGILLAGGLIPEVGLWFGGLGIVVVAVAIWTLRRPSGLTDAGAAEWAKVEGFKLYLTVAEADRLKFTDAPAKTPELFSRLLPYAVALNVEKAWAEQFKGLDMAPSTAWYTGDTNWTAVALASSLGQDFSPAVGSGLASPSSSTGAGGSFSGGGVGGGGGGSW